LHAREQEVDVFAVKLLVGVDLEAGIAATAEAVSCVQGAMTTPSFKPTTSRTGRRTSPSTVPGSTSSGKSCQGKSSLRTTSGLQAFRTGSSNCVETAFVRSQYLRPVRK
jgi:hypothetical protein